MDESSVVRWVLGLHYSVEYSGALSDFALLEETEVEVMVELEDD